MHNSRTAAQSDFFGGKEDDVDSQHNDNFQPNELNEMNGGCPLISTVNIDSLSMSRSKSSEETSTHGDDDTYNDCAQLAINGIPVTLSRNMLHGLLTKYGRILNLKIRRDKNYHGQNFAYVTYHGRAEALAALNALKSPNFGQAEGFSIGFRLQARLYDPRVSRSRANPSNFETHLVSAMSPPIQRYVFTLYIPIKAKILNYPKITGSC